MYSYTPTDLYYACLLKRDGSFDSWDSSGNDRFGEIHTERVNFDQVNLHPVVAVSRLAVWNTDQIETYVRKVIRYESSAQGKEWTKRAIVAGADFGRENATTMAKILKGLKVTTFSDRVPAGEKDVEQLDQDHLTAAVNDGALFIAFSGHGWDGGWAGAWNARAALPTLHNADRLPVICSSACLTQLWAWGTPLNADGTHSPPSAEPIKHWAEPPLPPAPIQPEPAIASWSKTPARVDWSMATFMLTENENGAIAQYGFSNVAQGGWCDALIQGVLKAYARGGRISGDLWAQSISAYADDRELFDEGGNPVVVGHWSRRGIMVQPYKFVLFGDPSLRIGGLPPKDR